MSRFAHLVKEYLIDKKWILLGFGGLIGLMGFGIIQMLGTMDMAQISTILAGFPEGFLDFFGDSLAAMTTPYGFLSLEFFNFMWLYAGIFIMYLGASVLSQEVEDNTIELALTKPISRGNFLGSKIAYFYLFIAGIMGVTFLILTGSVFSSSIFITEGVYIDRLWCTFLISVLFLGALSILPILFSTIFLNTKKAMAFGTIVMFTMYFIGIFASYFDQVSALNYGSVFFYYNPSEYLTNGNLLVFFRDLTFLVSFNAVLIIVSIVIFKKKDIPL